MRARTCTCDDLSMTTPADQIPNVAEGGEAPVRRLYRSTNGRVIGGVARGLSDHLGIDVLWIRLAFIGLIFGAGFGLVLYVAFWAFVPLDVSAPNRVAATSEGTPGSNRGKDAARLDLEMHPVWLFSLAALLLGGLLLLRAMGWFSVGYPFAFSIVLAAVGVAMVWRQADDSQRDRWLRANQPTWVGLVRLGGGAILVLSGGAIFIASRGRWSAAGG